MYNSFSFLGNNHYFKIAVCHCHFNIYFSQVVCNNLCTTSLMYFPKTPHCL